MSYLIFHHGSYYFQLRVPSDLKSRHGAFVRVNLQTQEAALAKVLALRLASNWLTRFDDDLADCGQSIPLPANAAPAAMLQLTPQPPPAPPIDSIVAIEGCRSQPASSDQPSLDDLFRMWQRLDNDRAPSAIKEVQSAIRHFRRACNTSPISLTRLDLSRYCDRLLNTEKLARTTVSKLVGMISTLLQVGYDAGLLRQNVARGIKIPKSDVPTLIRRSFSAEELERLFALPIYRNGRRPAGAGGEACIWIPMLALVTGARLEEIAQLRTIDLTLDLEHGPLLRVTNEGEGQRLKTDGSRRTIPLHPDVIAAGFLDYA
jgi:hypothetical protein